MTSDTMTPEIEAELRLALEDERSRLSTRVQELGEESRTLGADASEESGAGGQTADVATDLFEQEIDMTLQRSMNHTIEEVDEALLRMENGTYGRCTNCGEPIRIERLRAIPWARYCIQCASHAK